MPDAPAAWDKVTIRHLLNHTSGIPNFTAFPDFGKTKSIAQTPAEMVARFKDRPLEFAPGTRWNYTNSGYVLLGYLIERISGVSYEKFITDNIFTPLAMKDSGRDSSATLIARRASGYTPRGGGIQNADFVHMSITLGGGALYSTTGDLLRWEHGLFGGKLLKPETVAKMTTPVLDNYAMGLFVRSDNGRKQVAHPGGIEGFNAYTIHYPNDRLTVIVLANLNGPAAEVLATKLAAMALRDPKVIVPSERRRVALSAATLARYAGRYQVSPNVTAEVTTENGRIFIKMGNGPVNEIFAVNQNRFFRALPDGDLEFSGPTDSPAAELILYPESGDGAPGRAQRVSPG
jgi:CubicO group peptidase (beta-lactamase class C family)